jgi:transposase
MDHVAIDLGAKKSQICVRAADGQILEEKRWPTGDLETYLAGRPTSRVIVETCAEAFCVADAARKLGHETRVVPATLVKTLGVGARRLKTDRRDAQALSEVSCRIDLPSVHIPKTESRDRKTMCGMREALVGARTKIINTVRGSLSANVSETARPLKFTEQGERGSHHDGDRDNVPRRGDRGAREGQAKDVHRRVQAADREGSRRLQGAGRGRRAASA